MPGAFKFVPGPIPVIVRQAIFEADDYLCSACFLGASRQVELGIGAFAAEPEKWRTFCWACLLSTGATVAQLRFQLPREALRGSLKRPYPADKILAVLRISPASKRDVQRKTHLPADELESALSSLIHNGTVQIVLNERNRKSMVLMLNPKALLSPKVSVSPPSVSKPVR